jgi:hypothetical protein
MRLFSRLDKVVLLSNLNARVLVQFPVLDNHGEIRLMPDYGHVPCWIAANQQHVGEIAFFDLTAALVEPPLAGPR